MTGRLWPLILGVFALGLDAYVLAGLLPGMARDLGTTQALAGLGVALFTLAYAVSAPALSFAAGKYSTRRALLAGLALFTFGNAAAMLAPSLAAGDGESVFVNVIAFDKVPCAALLTLSEGDSVALAGSVTPKLDRQGRPAPASAGHGSATGADALPRHSQAGGGQQ